MSSTGTLAFTAAHRMIMRIHCYTSNLGAISFPSVTTGLAELLTFMLIIPNLADTSATFAVKFPNFTRRELH